MLRLHRPFIGRPCDPRLDSPGHDKRPTRANIKSAIAWLVDGASAGDALFFHYSGHGGRVPRTDGRGEWHETLCPADMDEAGMIHDNELFEMLVKPLPKGCRLTCILDACHSAGALDLPFIFTGTPENIKKAMAGEAIQKLVLDCLTSADVGDVHSQFDLKDTSHGGCKTGIRWWAVSITATPVKRVAKGNNQEIGSPHGCPTNVSSPYGCLFPFGAVCGVAFNLWTYPSGKPMGV
eukprot:Skav207393  [mRNA]  locus=scaffold2421:88998:92883:+ [translate_table: standard]